MYRKQEKIKRAPETKVDMKKTLIIKGLVIFGGGEIKSATKYYLIKCLLTRFFQISKTLDFTCFSG